MLAVEKNATIRFTNEMEEITAESKQIIENAMNDVITYGYDIRHYEYRYFFINKFYDTNFHRVSYGCCGCLTYRKFLNGITINQYQTHF